MMRSITKLTKKLRNQNLNERIKSDEEKQVCFFTFSKTKFSRRFLSKKDTILIFFLFEYFLNTIHEIAFTSILYSEYLLLIFHVPRFTFLFSVNFVFYEKYFLKMLLVKLLNPACWKLYLLYVRFFQNFN